MKPESLSNLLEHLASCILKNMNGKTGNRCGRNGGLGTERRRPLPRASSYSHYRTSFKNSLPPRAFPVTEGCFVPQAIFPPNEVFARLFQRRRKIKKGSALLAARRNERNPFMRKKRGRDENSPADCFRGDPLWGSLRTARDERCIANLPIILDKPRPSAVGVARDGRLFCPASYFPVN